MALLRRLPDHANVGYGSPGKLVGIIAVQAGIQSKRSERLTSASAVGRRRRPIWQADLSFVLAQWPLSGEQIADSAASTGHDASLVCRVARLLGRLLYMSKRPLDTFLTR
jgi:hypothetical protein